MMNKEVKKVFSLVEAAGGEAFLIGGCVRDKILRQECKDFDFEVFHLTIDELITALSKEFDLDVVGRAFGVIKVKGLPFDISLPRRDSKNGTGHKGFIIDSDPDMTIEEAAKRRDFTINTINMDKNGNLVDPFGGVNDLLDHVLRPVSEQSFADDPLRVLRAMQFIARFNMTPTDKLIELAGKVSLAELSHERIFEEFTKLILKGVKISKGLNFLKDCGQLAFFPELAALDGLEQDAIHHPEGTVWQHSGHSMDAFAKHRTGNADDGLRVGFAVLCHDFGKVTTTEKLETGRIISHGHEQTGEEPTRSFLGRMTNQEKLIDDVVALVANHLTPVLVFKDGFRASFVRRLATRVKSIALLAEVIRADTLGRPGVENVNLKPVEELIRLSKELGIASQKPKPLVMGRHLIELGMTPGVAFKAILDQCFEAQLEGMFSDEECGKMFLKGLFEGELSNENAKF